jgi:uncharacterized protein (DUF1810 family)
MTEEDRLRDCARLVCGLEGRWIQEIFGFPDRLKFRSSMTLFTAAAPDEAVFAEGIRKCCGLRTRPVDAGPTLNVAGQ